jgi:hypothetical protein
MSYVVKLTAEAEEDLRAARRPAPAEPRHGPVGDLARAPAVLSRPASFPHLPYQKYQFWSPDDTTHFTVLFEYGQDEQTLHVVAIGVVRY